MCAAANKSHDGAIADRGGRYPAEYIPNRERKEQEFTATDEKILHELMDKSFDPAKCPDYKLADIKIRCEKLFEEIFQFFDQERNYEPLQIFKAVERLNKVCHRLLEVINTNINADPDLRILLRGQPMQATPNRNQPNAAKERQGLMDFFANFSPLREDGNNVLPMNSPEPAAFNHNESPENYSYLNRQGFNTPPSPGMRSSGNSSPQQAGPAPLPLSQKILHRSARTPKASHRNETF